MLLRILKPQTSEKPTDDAQEPPRESSTITEKTLGDFIRMVRQTGILKLPKAD